MSITLESCGFPTLMRTPDLVLGATEETEFRFEEKKNHRPSPVAYEYLPGPDGSRIIIHPGREAIKYLRLRWRGDLSFAESVLGDEWGRIGSCYTPAEWRSVMPCRPLPWFCYVRGKAFTAAYGVKTGCDCFAFFQVDSHGITLFLNLMSGSRGTSVQESFVACEVVETINLPSETVYQTAKRFMSMLCPNPVLPKEPIFGTNNWYWAYGNITRKSVLAETAYLMELTDGTRHRPSLIIDDGWQLNRTPNPHFYNGGTFAFPNEAFGDMAEVASRICERGARPGIWYRPLLTLGSLPEEAILRSYGNGLVMDPTHPYTLERLQKDAARIRSWGYEIIKHDFTTNDALACDPLDSCSHTFQMTGDAKGFYDNTKTTATILKNMYRIIQNGAADADVIGCSAIGHLSAGIHSIQRVGVDTSGRSFEWTVRNGVHSFMRLPMNDTFFRMDPDCAAFTDMVDPDCNLEYLELCALTGVVTLASVPPGSLSDPHMRRINGIYRMADENSRRFGIAHFERTAIPDCFASETGEVLSFDWSAACNGSRTQIDWMK